MSKEIVELLKMLQREIKGNRKSAFKDDYYFEFFSGLLDKALAELEQKPEEGEFTKEVTIFIQSKLFDYTFDEAMAKMAKYLKQACNIINSQAEQIRQLQAKELLIGYKVEDKT